MEPKIRQNLHLSRRFDSVCAASIVQKYPKLKLCIKLFLLSLRGNNFWTEIHTTCHSWCRRQGSYAAPSWNYCMKEGPNPRNHVFSSYLALLQEMWLSAWYNICGTLLSASFWCTLSDLFWGFYKTSFRITIWITDSWWTYQLCHWSVTCLGKTVKTTPPFIGCMIIISQQCGYAKFLGKYLE